MGAAEPLVPDATAEADDLQNRRAVVFDTRRGTTCLAQRQHLRIAWYRKHCVPIPTGAPERVVADCTRVLDEVESEN